MGEARLGVGGNKRGAREGGRLWVPLPPRPGFCKLPSSFHLMQPFYPLLQAARHWAHLGRFPSCSRWGPQKRGLRGLVAPPSSNKAAGGAPLEARAAAPGTTGSSVLSREASLAQSDVHPFELPPWGILPCASPKKQSTGCGGVGWKWRLSTQGCLSGTAGQVGAVLSAPTAEPPPQR